MLVSGKRLFLLIPASVMLLGTLLAALPSFGVDATETITSRTLTLSSSNPAASNATTTYSFTFTVGNTSTPIQSIGIQICDTADGACTNNVGDTSGFSNASAALNAQPTGLGASSGWTMRASPPSQYELDIVNASNSTNPSGSQTIVFKNVQNPTVANQAFFARITTYSDAFTTPIDNGVVAASTANLIQLTGTMPESLVFCTGQTVSETNSVPDCSTATAGNITFNQDFSPTTTSYATSQMAATTNALSGYVITVSGPTLTSGGNTISGMATGLSTPGTGQFGMNLALDTAANSATPAINPQSAAVTPTAGTWDKGEASTGFNTGGDAATAQYTFVANSLNDVADSQTSETDPQIFTSTYIVNVAGHQPAGSYTTTLTYICTPTF